MKKIIVSTELREALRECIKELESAKVPFQKEKITHVVLNGRLSRSLGRCKRKKGTIVSETFSIDISRKMLTVDKKHLKNTIIHELIHTVNGCFNHGDTWKKWGSVMNKKFGYNIQRLTDPTRIGLNPHVPVRHTAKYVIVCNSCGNKTERTRASKVTRNPEYYRCGRCKGEISVEKY